MPDASVLTLKSGCRNLEGTGRVANVVIEGGTINPATGTDVGTLTVSNLTFNGGGLKFDFAAGSNADFVRVTGSLSNVLATPIPIAFSGFATNECPVYPLLSAANLGSFTADNFSLTRSYIGLPDGYLDLRLINGTNTLCFAQTRPVILLTSADAGGTSSYTNNIRWSDNAAPTADKDYWVAGNELRSPESSVATAVFPGHSLTLTAGSHKIKNAGVTINDLRLRGGTIIQGGGTSPAYLAGTSTVDAAVSSPFNFEIETSVTETVLRQFIVRSTLQGSGDIRFRYSAANNYPYGGIFSLTATNAAFTGGITVCGYKTVELRISDERNLGGNPAAFRADQLRLSTNGVLFALTSLAVDDANRGITLDNSGVLRMETNNTLTVAVPITGNGKLIQRGAGKLVLSGTNTYWGGTSVESNTTLEVRSEWALGVSNGVACASNVVLRVPYDASLLPLGVRLGGTTPLTVADTLRVVPVFTNGTALAKAFDLPVFLLTQATTFDTSLLTPTGTPSGYSAAAGTRTVSDSGTSRTQVYIRYRWTGLVLLVQ
jgi:autotransporter-associated beta strand protein